MNRKKTNRASLMLASAIASSFCWGSFGYGYITIGDFENNNNEGWFDWSISNGGSDNGGNPGGTPGVDLPAPVYTYSTEGATLGSSALAATVAPTGSSSGYYQGIAIKGYTQNDSQGNSDQADMANSKMLAMDVTYNTAEWTGASYNNLALIINFGGGVGGAAGFINLANNGSQTDGYPSFDTGNPNFPGGWDPTDYPGTTTRTMYWDYGDYVPAVINGNPNTMTLSQLIGPNPSYVEFLLKSSSNVQGTFHFDNIRLTQTTAVNANWTNAAGVNADGTFHWGTLANWSAGSGLPSNPGDIVNFTGSAIGVPTTVTLNGNEEFQVSVGTMNFNSGPSYTIAQGTGGSLTLDGTTTTFNYSQTFAATTRTVTPGAAQINDLFGNHTISAPVVLATNATVAVGQVSNVFTISGKISGTGGLTVGATSSSSGLGTVALSGLNTYTGGTTVTSGVLDILPTTPSSTTGSALAKGAVTISGSGKLVLSSNVTLGSQTANPPTTTPNSNVNITSLSITGNGTLDIGNNHVIINYGGGPDPIASIATLISNGAYAGATPGAAPATWTGTGITSSAAQANNTSYGIGFADAADAGNPAGLASGQIEVMYTLLGDANLDGKVNGTDFAILATDFNQAATSWDQGDFNYDHKVNGSDFAFIASNFNQGASQAADQSLVAFAAANGLLADVPEPASTALLLLGGVSVLTRRKRASIS